MRCGKVRVLETATLVVRCMSLQYAIAHTSNSHVGPGFTNRPGTGRVSWVLGGASGPLVPAVRTYVCVGRMSRTCCRWELVDPRSVVYLCKDVRGHCSCFLFPRPRVAMPCKTHGLNT